MAPSLTAVVALTGPSGVGKTTLARSVNSNISLLPEKHCKIIHQDDYFKVRLDNPADYGPERPNLETPRGVDWPRFVAAIEHARDSLDDEAASGGLVVVEGFLLLAGEGMGDARISALPLFDAIFFLDCPGEECLRRRLARNAERNEEQTAGLKSYWRRCTWPGYLEFTAPVLRQLQDSGDDRLVVIDAWRSEAEVELSITEAVVVHPRLPTLHRYRRNNKL